jgi:hypothetical protein
VVRDERDAVAFTDESDRAYAVELESLGRAGAPHWGLFLGMLGDRV